MTDQIRHQTQVKEDRRKELKLSATKNETSNWDDFSPYILELNSWTGKF